MADVISSTDPGRGLAFGGWTAGDAGEVVGRKGQVRITTPGPGTWTPPAGVTSVYVECVGAGGGGDGGQALVNGGGGGGGAYAAALWPVVPGSPVPYAVGAGGQGQPGGSGGDNGQDTTWNLTGVVAKGGGGGGPGIQAGAGGDKDACTGTVRFSGGHGRSGEDEFVAGAGGGAGGRAGDGEQPVDMIGGIGKKPGGNGAEAATNNSLAGVAGVGGGGGGGQGNGAYTDPSNGGDGIIIISWGFTP